MGAKLSRRKSDGAGAPSEQKLASPKADAMPAEEAPQVEITQAAVEEPDVPNKSMETVEAKMASVSVEDSPKLVAAVPEPKRDSLIGFSQEASTKTECSAPESPAEPVPIPSEPLTTEDQSIPEAPELGAEAVVGDVKALAMEKEVVSGTGELLVCVTQDDELSPAEPLK